MMNVVECEAGTGGDVDGEGARLLPQDGPLLMLSMQPASQIQQVHMLHPPPEILP
jgi:hypothetical protein